jgi:hypothetical protein
LFGIVPQYSGDAPGMVKRMLQVNFQLSALIDTGIIERSKPGGIAKMYRVWEEL